MAKRFLFQLAEVVMFIVSSNPSAIRRMKARAGGFFKGTVLRETRTMVYIKPLNKDLMERMKGTSFYHEGVLVKGRLLDINTVSDLTLSDRNIIEYLAIPKKQVEHWLGEKRRLNDALDRLRGSDLVKNSSNSQKKVNRTQKWVYNPN